MRISNKLAAAITAFATLSVFTFSACNRLKKDATDEDTGYAADHASLEKTFSDAQSIADEADDAGTGGSMASYRIAGGGPTVLGQCANIIKDTTTNTHKLTVDFGATNCLCKDGNYRRGKIIIAYTGRYRDMGHIHTISFDNYFVNDNQVTGTKTVSYNSNDAAGNPKYDISVDGQIILANSAGTLSWTSTRTRTWLQGYTTKDWSDDVYEISGSGNVTRANGKTFAVEYHNAAACGAELQLDSERHRTNHARWRRSTHVGLWRRHMRRTGGIKRQWKDIFCDTSQVSALPAHRKGAALLQRLFYVNPYSAIALPLLSRKMDV